MNITLYQNTIALNKLNRTLTGAVTIAGYLRESCDILNPDIEIEYNSAYLSKNYAYIPQFSRYYTFRKPPTIDTGRGLIILHLHVDVLFTYRACITRSQCIAERSSSHYNLNFPDNAVMREAGYDHFSGVLPYTFTPQNGSYVLTVTGGGVSNE